MSRKFYVLISVLLIAVFVLSACQPAEEPAVEEPAVEEPAAEEPAAEEPAAEEPVAEEPVVEEQVITIWHQWDGRYLDAITEAFDAYEADHPGVTIDLSKPEDVANALNIAIPAGEGPDIIGWANDKIGEQALNGNIVPLDDLGVTMDFLTSTYGEAAVNGVQYADLIWALPETQEGIALLYNKAIVTEEYLPTDADDFEDLLAKATAFQEDTGNVLVCNQGFGNNDAYHNSPVYFGFGVPAYVDDEGVAYMNTDEGIAAAEWMVQFSEVSFAENTYDICNAALAEGQAGMWWTGPWAVAGVEEAGIDYGILPMGKPFVGIKSLMVTQNAVDRGNAELALDVIKYFTSAPVQKELSLVNKTIPAAIEALEDPEVQELTAVVGFGAALNRGIPMSSSPFASAQWDPVGKASVAVWNGEQTPAEAMADAQAAIEQAVMDMQ